MRGGGSWLLAAGATAGAALAALSIAGRHRGEPVPDDAVAVVDGAAIRTADYQAALAAVAADRRGALDPGLRRQVLDRLVDEQLLIARGLELGLAERDPRVRGELAAAVLDLEVRRDDGGDDPDEATLRRFYADQADRFRDPPVVDVEVLGFADDEAAATARAAGLDAARARARPLPLPLPAGPLPVGKLRDYLGDTAARAVLAMQPGELGPPLRTAAGVVLLHLRGRRAGGVPGFEVIRGQVAAELRRSAGEARLNQFLAERRAAAAIRVAEDRL